MQHVGRLKVADKNARAVNLCETNPWLTEDGLGYKRYPYKKGVGMHGGFSSIENGLGLASNMGKRSCPGPERPLGYCWKDDPVESDTAKKMQAHSCRYTQPLCVVRKCGTYEKQIRGLPTLPLLLPC